MAAPSTGGSVFVLTTTIGNTMPRVDIPDVVTRNDRQGTIVGQNAQANREIGFAITVVGYEALYKNISSYNTAFGAQAGYNTVTGQYNTFVGAYSGACNVTGGNSTYLGTFSGRESSGENNTFLGMSAGRFNRTGANNIAIGVRANSTSGGEGTSYSIVIGNEAQSLGSGNIVLGHNAVVTASGPNAIVMGHNSTSSSPDAMILGNNVRNTGSNVFMVMTSRSTDEPRFNNESDIININDKFIMGTGDSNARLEIRTNNITLGDSNASHIRITPSNVLVSGNNITLNSDSNINITSGESITLSNADGFLALGPSNVKLDATDQLILSNSSNTSLALSVGGIIGDTEGDVVLSNNLGYLSISQSNAELFHACNVSLLTKDQDSGGYVGVIGSQSNLVLLGFDNRIEFFEDRDMSISSGCNLYVAAGDGGVTSITAQNSYMLMDADGINMSVGDNGVGVYITDSNVNIVGGINASGNFNLAGNAYLDSNLRVSGDVLFASNMTVEGPTRLNSNLTVDGVVQLNSNLVVAGVTQLNNNLWVDGNANINSNLEVGGVGVFNSYIDVVGPASFNNTVDIANTLYVDGATDFGSNLRVGGVVLIESNVDVKGVATFDSNISVAGDTLLQQDLTVLGNTNIGGDTFMSASLSVDGAAVIGSNLHVLDDFAVDGNSVLNGTLSVSESAYLKNNLNVDGLVTFNSNITAHGIAVFNSNIVVQEGGSSDFYGDVVFHGDVSGLGLSNYINSMISQYVTSNNIGTGGGGPGTGIVTIGDFYEPCPAWFDPESTTIESSLIINCNLHVEGEACIGRMRVASMTVGDMQFQDNAAISNVGNISMTGEIVFQMSNEASSNATDVIVYDGWWKQYIEYNEDSVDLVFRSKRGTLVTFQDEFFPEVLNFTGKHRCLMSGSGAKSAHNSIGMIVVATGKYENLQGKREIGIDEAIPVIEMCNEMRDKRVFGVIGGVEKEGKFRIGNMCFSGGDVKGQKTIVQSSGEGGIWVSNFNGPLQNGDYITTSPIKGLGMMQEEDYNANFTVAKITCDCSFELASDVYKCVEFTFRGKFYRKAFVGCVYCC